MTTSWTADMLAGIAGQDDAWLPLLPPDLAPIAPDLVVWDMWPLAGADGAPVRREGRSAWFFLAATRLPDPAARHDMARIHLLTHDDAGWRHHGPVLPEGFGPGTREWSGSALLDGQRATLFFTAAGRRGEPFSYEQRLVETHSRISWSDGVPRFGGWSSPVESVAADDRLYAHARQREPVNGRIKGFRDPGWFRDPADGADYLAFTGSAGGMDAPFDGVIGLARRDADGWTLRPPLVSAIGVASELERPHVIVRDGRYYLFWSTPAARFALGVHGVTGLFGMVAAQLAGPWRPLNGTSLVAANPPVAPAQAYCWWVTPDGAVQSFVDMPGGRFAGVPAPPFRLAFAGNRVRRIG